MCGIAGYFGDGEEADLSRMVATIAHRGPDDEGIFRDPELGLNLAHRRLSIIDPGDGQQPMSTPERDLVVIFNGEIYNHIDLRKDLEKSGCVFRTDHSDTEVLLHAYREWGMDFVERLNGMWAFAIFDRPKRRLLLSRDRFGQKPLYYATPTPGSLVFGSELTAVMAHSRVETGLSQQALRKYFAYGYVPAPGSIIRGIHKLPAGHQLVFEASHPRPHLSRYYEFCLESDPADARAPDVERLGEELLERLDRAVERRMMADVPLGVFLSGGIDSSAIAQSAASQRPAGALATFAIGFEDASFDESVLAEQVARQLGTRHRMTRFSPEALWEVASEVAAGLDEPMGDSSILPTYLLCRDASRHVRVALGGDGADELFAGYDPFRALQAAEAYARVVPRPLHRAIRMLASRLPTAYHNISFDFKIKRTLAGLGHDRRLWNPIWMGALGPAELAELLAEPIDLEDLYSEAIDAWEACASDSLVDQTLQFFTRLYLQDGILTKVDRASMLNGLEVRSPFLDRDLVDFARRIPSALKLRRGQTKWILKHALRNRLPASVRMRAKKGFGVPVAQWFREGRLGFEGLSNPRLLDGVFHQRALREHRGGRADHRLYLFNQWLLCSWLDRHAEN